MRRLLALFLTMLLLLCGCAQQPAPTTHPTVPATMPTDPSIPEDPIRPDFGLYVPGSTIEVQTNGAVKYLPLVNTGHYAVEPMGDGLLLFSGEDETTLTFLQEESDPVSVKLDCYVYLDNVTMRICQDGLYYFNYSNNEVVHLGPSLQEIARIKMPDDAKDTPALSSDGKLAYYFSEDALHCFDLSTGISRLLRVSTFQTQQLWGLHFDDSVLKCFVFDGENSECQFVSTATGALLAAYDVVPEIETDGERYFAEYPEFDHFLNMIGTRGEKPQCFEPVQPQATVKPLLELNGSVVYESDETGTNLHYYDLEQGTHSAQVRLDGVGIPSCVTADEVSGLIWILAYDLASSEQALYCWDPQLSLTGDETSYLTPYYTALEPDEAGLAEIAKRAKALGDQYGVRIQVWEDAQKVMPPDYTFELEHRVSAYETYLPALEKTLSAYPEGFLKKLGKASKNGVLTISLVRQIYGNNALGGLTTASGVHYWDDGSGYIAVIMGDVAVDQNVYHEIFHAIDSYVISKTTAYDNWLALNPDDFQYDYSYVNNQFREDYRYLENENRAFIDMYSMSFPGEDRARVMEYAMMPDNKAYFESDIMQAKLKTICKGIRAAFGLKKYTEPLIWEQYLKEALI